MNKKLERVSKIYSWYDGLSSDLLFYAAAINTVWLTVIKGFPASQVILMTAIANLFSIFFQIPALTIVKKIGNTNSVKVSALCFVVTSTLLTFSERYLFFVLAMVIYEMAFMFRNTGDILIRNNLEFLKKENEYIGIKNKGNVIYAVATTLIALMLGFLFNLHHYLPMLLCITTTFVGLILTFFIFDIEEKSDKEEKITEVKTNQKLELPQPLNFALWVLLLYGLVYGLLAVGQLSGQLLIQLELQKFFSLEKTAVYLGVAIFASRLVRILLNVIYPKIYKKLVADTGLVFAFLLVASFLFILLGFYIPNIVIRIIIITIGFSFLPSIRDPFKLYTRTIIFGTLDKMYHQEMFYYSEISRKTFAFVLGMIASSVLAELPLQYVMIILLATSLPVIYISAKVIKGAKKKSKKDSILINGT